MVCQLGQYLNEIELVKELNLAVEITMDYRDGTTLVSSEEVANGVKKLMDSDGEVRQSGLSESPSRKVATSLVICTEKLEGESFLVRLFSYLKGERSSRTSRH
ncbi:hypothetical protein K7X08_017623 [Anisodus acutangulus]|uniref:Uncharacterized protein n=1 Tax=Anisodus acutangulus TaxID=402998 RepID=A0A9Q1R8D3_9SOLA|nr:hypothetical protein K7X08_017623 [Anisodus acutangulus]